MFGVLVGKDSAGRKHVLKAFSGLLDGQRQIEGWVDFWVRPEPTPLERATKARLKTMKEKLKALASAPCFQELSVARAKWAKKRDALDTRLRIKKSERKAARIQGKVSPEEADGESRADSRELRDFKRQMQAVLTPLQANVQQHREQILSIKAERKTLSKTLQAEMHQHFGQSAFQDMPCSLASLFPNGPPTGTGECCAPKLLAHARKYGIKPSGMAEFWWGPSQGDKRQGEFYPACNERCQPMMGALLSDASYQPEPLYLDEQVLVADKPSGLLTVPGRQAWNQDSLYLRLREDYPDLLPVHRLDLETSGLVVFARDQLSQSKLQDQFSARRVKKHYRALVTRECRADSGVLSKSIGPNPNRPGRYCLDSNGKWALSHWARSEEKEKELTLTPISGRSHQLRVHCAFELGNPIAGDPLYGHRESAHRLMLHASSLEFDHPATGKRLLWRSEAPF